MLEVFYITDTKIVTAWRSEPRIGIRELRDGESKVLLDIEPPTVEGANVRDYLYDEPTQTLVLRPDYVEPEPSDLQAQIDEMKGKMVVSEPPAGMAKIKNLYKDPETDEMVGEGEDE